MNHIHNQEYAKCAWKMKSKAASFCFTIEAKLKSKAASFCGKIEIQGGKIEVQDTVWDKAKKSPSFFTFGLKR